MVKGNNQKQQLNRLGTVQETTQREDRLRKKTLNDRGERKGGIRKRERFKEVKKQTKECVKRNKQESQPENVPPLDNQGRRDKHIRMMKQWKGETSIKRSANTKKGRGGERETITHGN